jgi:hypothetical protein
MAAWNRSRWTLMSEILRRSVEEGAIVGEGREDKISYWYIFNFKSRIIEQKSFKSRIIEQKNGLWCGQVEIPEDHPWNFNTSPFEVGEITGYTGNLEPYAMWEGDGLMWIGLTGFITEKEACFFIDTIVAYAKATMR